MLPARAAVVSSRSLPPGSPPHRLRTRCSSGTAEAVDSASEADPTAKALKYATDATKAAADRKDRARPVRTARSISAKPATPKVPAPSSGQARHRQGLVHGLGQEGSVSPAGALAAAGLRVTVNTGGCASVWYTTHILGAGACRAAPPMRRYRVTCSRMLWKPTGLPSTGRERSAEVEIARLKPGVSKLDAERGGDGVHGHPGARHQSFQQHVARACALPASSGGWQSGHDQRLARFDLAADPFAPMPLARAR